MAQAEMSKLCFYPVQLWSHNYDMLKLHCFVLVIVVHFSATSCRSPFVCHTCMCGNELLCSHVSTDRICDPSP